MATADLKLLYGSGGGFVPSFFSGRQVIASGASGTLLTLTPPVGKRVRIVGLSGTTTNEANISITCDGVAVITSLTLSQSGPASSNAFAIGTVLTSTNLGQGVGAIEYLQANSSLTITKTTGSTTGDIAYCYMYGE